MSDVLHVLVVGILLGGIYGLVSIGLNLIFGVIRVVNFAHGELVMLGMYGAFLAYSLLGIDPYLSVVIVVPALFLFGLIVQRLIIEPLQSESMMQMFATFALLTILQNVVLAITRGEGHNVPTKVGSLGLELGDIRIPATRFIILIAVTAIAVLLHLFLHRTLLG